MHECSYISLRENASRDAYPRMRPSIKRMQGDLRDTERRAERGDTGKCIDTSLIYRCAPSLFLSFSLFPVQR